MIVLAMRDRSQIVGSDPDAAVMTPYGLEIGGGCYLCLRSLHFSDLLVRGTVHGMRDIIRRIWDGSGPTHLFRLTVVCSP
jgi:hypothetical protein